MFQAEKNRNTTILFNIIKPFLFIAVFLMVLFPVTKIVTSPGNYLVYQWIRGFYEEEKDSLDAVYIGSSEVYAFWQAALGWDFYGISVWPYATSSQPLQAVRYIIEDARKTQPDALYIIDIPSNDLSTCSLNQIHWLTDYMPWSLTKLKLIHSLCKMEGYTLMDSLEFYLPLYRYHARWDELVQQDFSYELDGTKGGSQYNNFLKTSKDVSGSYRKMDLSGELSDETETYFNGLFDYIDQEHIKVLLSPTPV